MPDEAIPLCVKWWTRKVHMWQFAIVNLYQKRQSSQMKNSEVWLDIEDCYAVETCYDKGGVGEVLTPILVLPWRGGSAAQRGTAPCNAVHFCAMQCAMLCNAVQSRLSTCRMRGKCLRGSSGGQLIQLHWLLTTGSSWWLIWLMLLPVYGKQVVSLISVLAFHQPPAVKCRCDARLASLGKAQLIQKIIALHIRVWTLPISWLDSPAHLTFYAIRLSMEHSNIMNQKILDFPKTLATIVNTCTRHKVWVLTSCLPKPIIVCTGALLGSCPTLGLFTYWVLPPYE